MPLDRSPVVDQVIADCRLAHVSSRRTELVASFDASEHLDRIRLG